MLSGGLDSAVLAAQEARTYVVHPVYVAGGLAWEEGEQDVVRRPDVNKIAAQMRRDGDLLFPDWEKGKQVPQPSYRVQRGDIV